jgi:hypothetical protein
MFNAIGSSNLLSPMLANEAGVAFLVVLGVLGVIGIGVLAYRARQAKIRALTEWAHRHGCQYRNIKDRSVDDRYPEFGCFHHGHSRYASDPIEGEWNGRQIKLGTYHYTTGSGRNQSHHSFTYFVLRGDMPLQPLTIRPENVLDKLAGAFGFDDIDFESAEFSKRFLVKAKDRKWAYDVLHARAMEHLLDHRRSAIEFSGYDAMIQMNGRTLKLEEYEATIGVLEQLLDMLPAYVVEQQKGRGR